LKLSVSCSLEIISICDSAGSGDTQFILVVTISIYMAQYCGDWLELTSEEKPHNIKAKINI
jgi:hypothetical protein